MGLKLQLQIHKKKTIRNKYEIIKKTLEGNKNIKTMKKKLSNWKKFMIGKKLMYISQSYKKIFIMIWG